ncbi:hypothetical protein ACHAW6_002633 [Cyclotella cf. meneghiniana]
MKKVKSSTLINSARSHLESVQNILKQVNEDTITVDTHHINQKHRSDQYSSVYGCLLTGAPLRHRTSSGTSFGKSDPWSFNPKAEFDALVIRHLQQESRAIEWERTAMRQQKGRRKSDATSSLTLTCIRLDKPDASLQLSCSRNKMSNDHILSTDDKMRTSQLAPFNKGRSLRIQKQDRKHKIGKCNISSQGTLEFSRSDSNISRECMTYPCYRDRSELTQFRVRRLPSSSEEASTSDFSNKFSTEDVLPPSILRRAKTVSDIVRLEKRVSFIDDRSTSNHSNNMMADEIRKNLVGRKQ